VLKLMIVDDEPLIIKGLMNIIEKGNAPCSEIVSAGDAFEALEKLETFRPDLLITDIEMPEMSGLELIRKVQAKKWCERFVILTGYDEPDYLRQAIRSRVIDYLLKPINKTELYNVLNDISVELLQTEEKEAASAPDLPDSPMLNLKGGVLSKHVRRIIRYIEQHYDRDISLEELAEHVYLHPAYISSLFKEDTGLTFLQYLNLYRIKQAKTLILHEPDLSFQEIAERVGYRNARHFFNVFKKYCGETPGQFRERTMIH